MKFEFNIALIDLDGNPLVVDDKELTAGRLLSNILKNSNRGNATKLYGIALDLYHCKPLYLDKADKKMLCEWIETEQNFTHLAKYQLLEILEKGIDD